MKVILSHKIRMKPTPDQELVLIRACGISRYTYNWALARWKQLKSEGVEKVTRNELKKEWNQVKPDWVYDAPKDANQQPFTDLYNGFSRYYKNGSGFPKFKSKNKSRDSFYVSNDKAKLVGSHSIRLPKVGRVQLCEPLRWKHKDVKIMSYTISRSANQWFVSISVQIDSDKVSTQSPNNMIGLDLGIKEFIVDSNDEHIISPKPLKKHKKKLAKLQRKLSRTKKDSKNREKRKRSVAKQHLRISNIRKDFLHKLSNKITKENRIIVTEDLNVKGMLKNHKLAFHIQDASWYEFTRQIEYKSKRTNSIYLKVDRFFPSTKTCSECGAIKESMNLSEREYTCHECGTVKDRDHNAAINILAMGLINLIPGASGKYTPVEIVSLVESALTQLNTIDETFEDDFDPDLSVSKSLTNNEYLLYLLRKQISREMNP
jgi:putative transposase